MSKPHELLDLNEDELKLIQNVLRANGVAVDETKSKYTEAELKDYGFVRENWSVGELIERGYGNSGVIDSFSQAADKAKSELTVDAPFADGVQKWQLPIPLPGFRVVMTRFPPNTVVKPHVHPNIDGVSACGQLRVVVKGSITYAGQKYGPGDWFYIPNDKPYSFVTDPDVETLENYYYQYNGFTGLPMRFSSLRPLTE